jgi:Bacterial Ig domain/Bacterial TSP3 repeat/Thrombospondin type 3 repeat
MRLRLVVPAATVAILALALPAGATAAPCAQTLKDNLNFDWKFQNNGSVKDGGKPGSADPYGSAAIDSFAALGVDTGGGGFGGSPFTGTANGCTLAQNGREIVYPEEDLGGGAAGLRASRRVYVPPPGATRSFARWIDTIRNPTNATRKVDVSWTGGLGSDCGTRIASESSGNDELDERDRWAVTFDPAPADDTCGPFFGGPNDDDSTGLPLAHNWDGLIPVGGTRTTGFAQVFGLDLVPGGGYLLQYHDIAIAPGQSASLVHFESQTTTLANDFDAATNAAVAIDAEPADLFAGMSAADLAKVRNWCARDCDHDTKLDSADNCPRAANGNQVDTDQDEAGDACDTDDDNDGRSDSVEAALGTDPLNPADLAPSLRALKAPHRARVGRRKTLKADATDDYGVRRVTFWLGNRRLCSDRSAPFRCRWKPKARDVGVRVLSVVAVDAIGQVAVRARSVRVKR